MADDTVVFFQKELPCHAFPTIADIRRQGQLCDVTLRVGDQKFSAHRIILAATIPYFHAMFTHDMVETKQAEITMESVEPSALEALINYAYTGRVVIDMSNVQSLLIVASFLNMQVVKDACSTYLKNRLEPSTCLSIRAFADQYMCSTLVEAANKYIQKKFRQVALTPDFLSLPKAEVLEILSRDELDVRSEEQVFEAVMRWIKHDSATRVPDLPELMVKVRLPLLTPQYLSDNVATEDIIKNSLQCRDLLDEAKDYHLMPERRLLMQTFKTRPRCCTDVPGFIFAVGGLTSAGDSLSTVERFDPLTGAWVTGEPMSTMRSRVGVTVLKGCLYAIGGYNGMERLDTVELYDPVAKKWSRVAAMNCKRSALGAVSLNDKVIVCGGYDGVTSLRSCETYDPDTNTWTMMQPMHKHRSAAGVTVLHGCVVACGGHDGLSIFDSVESYNPTRGEWQSLPPMRSKRCRLGVATLNGKVYAVGGYDGCVFLRTVERYDPDTQTWEMVAPMQIKRSRVAVAATYKRLYAIGGYDGQANLKSVEVYDPNTDEWTFATNMSAHEGGVGVGVVPVDCFSASNALTQSMADLSVADLSMTSQKFSF
ncbi:histone-lysine N-methyltransferase SETMAR [Plakobranchus ocellatus]|uniref:Histone-lysine N-methyltransferase SETMAR n=1 Tax=Plakobranchus ocellatus TaxID=259542 RepID=A0AAV4AJQ1_9GAST|nr:histone-lysine N-methyltransferase SETMAR [Plakobranchus ocellatus]